MAIGGLYWKHHNRAKLQGYVAGRGDKLVNENDNQTYSLNNPQNEALKPGERVELPGKKAKDRLGRANVRGPQNEQDLGQCSATTAER